MGERPGTVRIIITVSIILLYSLILLLHHRRNGITDDAFITYRYTYQLVSGHGFVYNQGEVVLGTTTPAYALLLSVPTLLTGTSAIPTISRFLNLFLVVVIMINMGIVTWKLSGKSWYVTLIMPVLVLASENIIKSMIMGMEAPLLLALLTGGIAALVYRRWLIGCCIVGLLPLVRPEGAFTVILVGSTVLYALYHSEISRRKVLLCIMALSTPALLYLGVMVGIYGTFLPQSVIAKSSGLYPLPFLGQSREVFAQLLNPFLYVVGVSDIIARTTETVSMIPLLLITIIVIYMIILGSIYIIRCDYVLWIVPILLLIHVLFYGTSKTLVFHWYHANYHLFVLILFCCGIFKIASTTLTPNKQRYVATGSALVIALLAFWNTPWSGYINTPQHPVYLAARELMYYDFLQQVEDQIPPDATIAMPEIGVLGYFLPENKVLDTAGLVSPEATQYYPVPLEELIGSHLGSIPRQLLVDMRPDIILSFKAMIPDVVFETDWFYETYEIAYSVPDLAPFGVTTELWLAVRKDVLAAVQLP